MIVVKLMQLGASVIEYSLEDGSEVSDLFDAAGKTFVPGSVTRRQCNVNEDTTLHDGDKIFVGNAVKGNIPFEVSFLRLGDSSVNLPAEDGYTIKRTLEQLDDSEKAKFYRADGKAAYEFRIGASTDVGENYVLQRPAGDASLRVICAQRVKGN